jgi:hypothetical protein
LKSRLTNEFTVRGSGPVGPYWAPIPYSWPYHGRTGAARRRGRETKHWRLLSSITGRIDVYLKSGRKEAPDSGAAAWFADNLGLFAKQTERYSAREFLRRYAKFLNETHHRTVLLTEIDYEEVYLGRTDGGPNNLDDALAKASEYLALRSDSNKLLLSTFGKTRNPLKDNLNFTLEAQYNRKHGHGKPGIEVRIIGIPSMLAKKPREADNEYRARMNRLFRDLSDLGKEKFAMRYENEAKILLRYYERQMYKFFDVAKSTRWLHLEWGKTGENLNPRVKF